METKELKAYFQMKDKEGFAIVVNGKNGDPELEFVSGVSFNEKYAAVRNSKGAFTVIHIESGCRVFNELTTFKELKCLYKEYIEKSEKKMKDKSVAQAVKNAEKRFQNMLEEYSRCQCKD